MNKKNLLKLLPWIGIAIVLMFAIIITIKVSAQNQFSIDIAERLAQEGVPVKQVSTINNFPYEIEISLQSTSTDDHLSIDDNWYMQLARREATFSYRINTRLDSFMLSVYNSNNILIYSDQTYLYPQDLNQKIELKLPIIDAVAAKEVIVKQLKLSELTLDRLDVNPDVAIGGNGQILLISVSAIDLETVNKSLPGFLSSLFRTLDTINDDYGTYIVLCHLRVVDGSGKILLDYVKDVESGSAQWTSSHGVYDDWFPGPDNRSDAMRTPTPIEEQFAYPAPLTTITPENALYPPPYP